MNMDQICLPLSVFAVIAAGAAVYAWISQFSALRLSLSRLDSVDTWKESINPRRIQDAEAAALKCQKMIESQELLIGELVERIKSVQNRQNREEREKKRENQPAPEELDFSKIPGAIPLSGGGGGQETQSHATLRRVSELMGRQRRR